MKYNLYPNKCNRCVIQSTITGEVQKQWCPAGNCYAEICRICGTPEKRFRDYKVCGAVFD